MPQPHAASRSPHRARRSQTMAVSIGQGATPPIRPTRLRRSSELRRGDSDDTQPYAVEREIEDLAAVIAATGGRAHLFGASSGGALALEAAAGGLPIDRVAVHEIPYLLGDEMSAAWPTYTVELAAALDRDDRDEALRLFMRLAGSSEDDIAGAASSTFWPPLRALAPTLRYDATCLGDGAPPAARLATIAQPVLLTTGVTIDPHSAGLPIDFFGAAADATADHLPDARRATIEAAGHVADPALLGSMLAAFYAADMSTTRPTVTSP